MLQRVFNLRNVAWFLIAWVFALPHIWLIYLNQNYVNPKRIIMDFLIVGATICLALEDRMRLPIKKIFFTTIVLLVLKVVATLLHLGWASSYSLLEAIALGIVVVYFMTVWKKYDFSFQTFYWPITFSFAIIVAVCAREFIIWRIYNGSTEPILYSGTFGNPNMMCEYLVLFLPLIIYLIRTSNKLRANILTFVLIGWVFILLVGWSRSAWMGLAACILYGLVKKLSIREWIAYAIAGALYVAVLNTPHEGRSHAEPKQVSISKREELYKGNLAMLLDNPLGVGGFGFEYSFLPYQRGTGYPPSESEGYDNPHSEPFKWGIENGWAFLAVNIVWWVLLAILVWQTVASENEKIFYRTTLMVIIPQLLFQFPFNNPASYYALGLLLAILLLSQSQEIVTEKKWKYVTVVMAVILFTRGVSRAAGLWIEAQHMYEPDAVELGCQIDPGNWRVCFYHFSQVVQGAYPQDAIPQMQKELRERPWNVHALHGMGYYYIQQNKRKEACEIGQVYDTIFDNHSQFTKFIADNCATIPNPVPFKNTSQFKHDYEVWLQNYLK